MENCEREWRIGVDLSAEDNLLDGVTFRELITTLRCNYWKVNPDLVRHQLRKIIDIRTQDMNFLLEKNMDVIIAEAMKGRG